MWLFGRKVKVLCARGLAYGLQAARPLCLRHKAPLQLQFAVRGALYMYGQRRPFTFIPLSLVYMLKNMRGCCIACVFASRIRVYVMWNNLLAS